MRLFVEDITESDAECESELGGEHERVFCVEDESNSNPGGESELYDEEESRMDVEDEVTLENEEESRPDVVDQGELGGEKKTESEEFEGMPHELFWLDELLSFDTGPIETTAPGLELEEFDFSFFQ